MSSQTSLAGKILRLSLVAILMSTMYITYTPRRAQAIAPAIPVIVGAAAVFATMTAVAGYAPIANTAEDWGTTATTALHEFNDWLFDRDKTRYYQFQGMLQNSVEAQAINLDAFNLLRDKLTEYLESGTYADVDSTLAEPAVEYIDLSSFGMPYPVYMKSSAELKAISGSVSTDKKYYAVVEGYNFHGNRVAAYISAPLINTLTAINLRTEYEGVSYLPAFSASTVGEIVDVFNAFTWYITPTYPSFTEKYIAQLVNNETWHLYPTGRTSSTGLTDFEQQAFLDLNSISNVYLNPDILYTFQTTAGLLTYNGTGWIDTAGQPIDILPPTSGEMAHLNGSLDAHEFQDKTILLGHDVIVGKNDTIGSAGTIDILQPTDAELNAGLTYQDVLSKTGAVATTSDAITGSTVSNPALAQTITIGGVTMTIAEAIASGAITSIATATDTTWPLNTGGSNNVPFSGKFPFCVPFDLIAVIDTLAAPPEVPKFMLQFPADLDGTLIPYEVDFTPFAPVATVVKSLLILLFIVGLVGQTRDLIKG